MTSKYLSLFEFESHPTEQFVSVELKDGMIVKKYYSSVRLSDSSHKDILIENLVIDHGCLMKESTKDYVLLEDLKTGKTQYYIWNDLLVEKVMWEEIEKINMNEIKEKLSIGLCSTL